jgi:hypothetical protein
MPDHPAPACFAFRHDICCHGALPTGLPIARWRATGKWPSLVVHRLDGLPVYCRPTIGLLPPAARRRYAKVAHFSIIPAGPAAEARHASKQAPTGAEDSMSNIQLDIEWTEAASRKIEKLMPRGDKEAFLALPPVECLPMEGDVLFLGPQGKQQPFIVAERQYHHDGDADWTIILILDVPQAAH